MGLKKIITWVAVLALLLCVAFVAYAHPGRTDEYGGHHDHDTGGYHYHHGYSAHQHYDMDDDGDIDCPYDFVDATESRSDADGLTTFGIIERTSGTLVVAGLGLGIISMPVSIFNADYSARFIGAMMWCLAIAVFLMLAGSGFLWIGSLFRR